MMRITSCGIRDEFGWLEKIKGLKGGCKLWDAPEDADLPGKTENENEKDSLPVFKLIGSKSVLKRLRKLFLL